MIGDQYISNLTNIYVCAIFPGKNVLPKFIELCIVTPCWCPSKDSYGHRYDSRKITEISVIVFAIKAKFYPSRAATH